MVFVKDQTGVIVVNNRRGLGQTCILANCEKAYFQRSLEKKTQIESLVETQKRSCTRPFHCFTGFFLV
jgi:hypothetical protein